MCVCNPNIRTPWCGKPGCEQPSQAKKETKSYGFLKDIHVEIDGDTCKEVYVDSLWNLYESAAEFLGPELAFKTVVSGIIDQAFEMPIDYFDKVKDRQSVGQTLKGLSGTP